MTETTMRKAPQQQRSQRRIDAILDAAEEVLLESGFGALTTNAVAARADVPIGSLYQFFPNKEAVVASLADRYLRCMRVALELVRAPGGADLSIGEWIDGAIDGLAQTNALNPAFHVLFCDAGISPELAQADAVLQCETFNGVVQALASRAPHLPEDQVRRYAIISIALVKAILPIAKDAVDASAVLGDAKGILRAYLEPVFGPRSAQSQALS
jgi:AcrR family transcriptional regulator